MTKRLEECLTGVYEISRLSGGPPTLIERKTFEGMHLLLRGRMGKRGDTFIPQYFNETDASFLECSEPSEKGSVPKRVLQNLCSQPV